MACRLFGTKPLIIWTIAGWVIGNCTLRNKLRWNFKQNTNIFIHKNAYENIICKMAAILSGGRWVNLLLFKMGDKILQNLTALLHRHGNVAHIPTKQQCGETVTHVVLNLFCKTWIYICVIYHLSTLKRHRSLRSAPMEEMDTCLSCLHGWPDDPRLLTCWRRKEPGYQHNLHWPGSPGIFRFQHQNG